MTRKERKEAVMELEAIAYEIYDLLEDMKKILEEVAPEELERAEIYWMAHIDGALLNLSGVGGSFISLEDTLTALEEEEFEEEEFEKKETLLKK